MPDVGLAGPVSVNSILTLSVFGSVTDLTIEQGSGLMHDERDGLPYNNLPPRHLHMLRVTKRVRTYGIIVPSFLPQPDVLPYVQERDTEM